MKEIINRWSRFGKNRSLGLLVIRFGTGLVFLMHGWSKIHGIAGVEGMMMGFGLPGTLGIFIAWLEVLGGVALILGILTRLFAILFFIEMVIAIYLTSLGGGLGYRPHELEIFLALMSLGVALTGSGRYSFFAVECHNCGGMACKGQCPRKQV